MAADGEEMLAVVVDVVDEEEVVNDVVAVAAIVVVAALAPVSRGVSQLGNAISIPSLSGHDGNRGGATAEESIKRMDKTPQKWQWMLAAGI